MSKLNDLDYESTQTQLIFADASSVRELQWILAGIIADGLDSFLKVDCSNLLAPPTITEQKVYTKLRDNFRNWDNLSVEDQDSTAQLLGSYFRYLWL